MDFRSLRRYGFLENFMKKTKELSVEESGVMPPGFLPSPAEYKKIVRLARRALEGKEKLHILPRP